MPQILICADSATNVQNLQRLLREAGHEVAVHDITAPLRPPTDDSPPTLTLPHKGGGDNIQSPLPAALGAGLLTPPLLPAALGAGLLTPTLLPTAHCYDLIVVEGSGCEEMALRFCRQLRAQLGTRLVPILYVTDSQASPSQMASLENGADTYLVHPFSPRELLAQVRAFVRMKGLHDDLLEKTAEIQQINKRLQAAHQQINSELELARRIQMSFLPQTLPDLPPRADPPGWGIRFAVHYALCGRVGGDFYDVFRLDEEHVGLYVADAMGHGVPASLLTIFVKKAVRTKEIVGQHYRLVPPDEVLRHLNRELIGEALADHPFITMTYALCNVRTGLFQFARAGHPYPLYIPRQSAPHMWQVDGSLLGIFESRFPVQAHRLQPGDKILLYTDGMDAASFPGHPPGSKSLVACAAAHAHLPVEAFVRQLARELFRESAPEDDLTLLGLEVYDNGELQADPATRDKPPA